MDYGAIHEAYVTIRSARLEALVSAGHLTTKQRDEFICMEDKINEGIGEKGLDPNWIIAFHETNDDYRRIFKHVLDGLVKLDEPGAPLKSTEFMAELGHSVAGVYNTPFEISLAFLDMNFGDFSEVAARYCN